MTQKYILNETPIRTSVGYKINDITIKDLTLPARATPFNTVEAIADGVEIEGVTSPSPLTYGCGKTLEENMSTYCNSHFHLYSKENGGKCRLNYVFDDDHTELSNHIVIDTEKDMDVTIVYRSTTEKKCYHNAILQINASKGAKIHVEVINLLNEATNHFLSVENQVKDDSIIEIVMVDMGAKNSLSNVYSNILDKQGEALINVVYVGQNDNLKDMNHITHLRGKKSIADIDLQGVLLDKSKKNLKFTIDFKSGCTGAKGAENESCMMLSKDARAISLPILLCTEDDVEGAHSAAAGKADPEQVFYIMSRGFSKQDAVKMLVRAKFNAILEKLNDQDLRAEIIAEVDRRLS